jgi:hypothetical protein
MKSRLGALLFVIAGFQLLGGHWALLQTAAWAGMIIDYSKSEGVEAGITKTFDGKHPCKLCLSIAENKQREAKHQGTNIGPAKLYLFYQTLRWALIPPGTFWELDTSTSSLFSTDNSPPVPPPRIA